MNFRFLIMISFNFFCFYVQTSQRQQPKEGSLQYYLRGESYDAAIFVLEHINLKNFKEALGKREYVRATEVVGEMYSCFEHTLAQAEIGARLKAIEQSGSVQQGFEQDISDLQRIQVAIQEQEKLRRERLNGAQGRAEQESQTQVKSSCCIQ